MILKMKNIIIIITVVLISISCSPKETSAKIKKSNLAGTWFSSNAEELKGQIDALLSSTGARAGIQHPLVLILPHAGYVYSGKTAAAGYRTIGAPGKNIIHPNLIIILGPSHHTALNGCAVLAMDFYETPLGKVKINNDIAQKLAGDLIKDNPEAFEKEHSLEIHLPFLQRIFGDKLKGDIQILPILVGEMSIADAKKTAELIASAVSGTRPLFIVSSDFTHYGPRFAYQPFRSGTKEVLAKQIEALDSGAIDFILKKDLAGFEGYVEKTGATICGRNPIKVAMALPVENFKAEKIMYDTSGHITGDYTNSVSYTALCFAGALQGTARENEGGMDLLTNEDKKFLLKIARENIASWLVKRRGVAIFPTDVPKNCHLIRGGFVTLKKNGHLRGCIGYVSGTKSIIKTVLDNSYNAAFKDPRFDPLQPDELKDVTIEISILTEPGIVKSIEEIKTGRDGLIMEQGMNRGLLLPQVATEQGWDRNTFLDQTCVKAGMSPGCWKDSDTKIFRFQAIVFGEDKHK